MLTYSKSSLFVSGMTHCLILGYRVSVTTLLISTLLGYLLLVKAELVITDMHTY